MRSWEQNLFPGWELIGRKSSGGSCVVEWLPASSSQPRIVAQSLKGSMELWGNQLNLLFSLKLLLMFLSGNAPGFHSSMTFAVNNWPVSFSVIDEVNFPWNYSSSALIALCLMSTFNQCERYSATFADFGTSTFSSRTTFEHPHLRIINAIPFFN